MSVGEAGANTKELRFYFIDDQAPDLVRRFEGWWKEHGPKNAGYKVEYLSQPPWLDEATQKKIDTFEPDLIVLDLILQHDVQSGERALRKLKTFEEIRDIPVFIYSSQISSIKNDSSRLRSERKYSDWGAQGLFAKLDGDDYVFSRLVEFAMDRKKTFAAAP